MIIPDVNVLVYAYNSDAPHHEKAKDWWRRAMNGHEAVGIPWVVSLGFLRLMTNRRVLARPMTALQAIDRIRSWMERRQVQAVHPGPRHLDILSDFADQRLISSTMSTDAHIAAIASELRADVYSNDADFSRFPGIRCRNPLL